ncbi:creatininase family protein [Ahrensia kielensis]|uniref:Creatininase family protein n=1 Tax=Ahrensia kielensis TaxID=76980 RepID=A0ABU9T4U1_9HYPH
MTRKIWWSDFSPEDFSRIDANNVTAILPLGATEQHGPHLPITTDSDIMDGMLNLVVEQLTHDLDVRIFPVERVGASDEHSRFTATQSLSSQQMVDIIVKRGEEANSHGIKKLVLVNSHGGNEPAMSIAALELRKRYDMLVVKTSWGRFGVPDDLFTDEEMKQGIHGGDYETSLMLAFQPSMVDMAKAQNFQSNTKLARETFTHLAPQSPHGFAWLAGDLNEHGVVGNAAAATAHKGRAAAVHQTSGFIELLRDVRKADLNDWIKL